MEKKGPDHKDNEKFAEELSKFIAAIKQVLYGDGEHDPNPEHVTQLAAEVYTQDLITLLIQHLALIEFEAKKDTSAIYNNLLRRQVGQAPQATYPTVEYLVSKPQTMTLMVNGYNQAPDIALACGAMLRESMRHEELVKILLKDENLFQFFNFVEQPNFDIASDAFSTFKELLTKHKGIVAEFLEADYDKFFKEYTKLLQSANYVTKRQSLKLLGELLLDRANFNVMTKYIAQSSNLKLMMNLLRDKRKSIQFEAFHVFKVFVANPNKPQAILDILVKNKTRLIAYLSEFHNDKDDEQFTDEKAYLLRQIESLPSE